MILPKHEAPPAGAKPANGEKKIMRNFVRASVAAATIVSVLGIGMVAGSAEDKEAAIKARRDTMKQMGGDFKAIADFTKGEGDQATALAKAQDLQALAPKIVALFIPGTSLADFPGKTGAKPEIWTEMDKVKAMIPPLEAAEQKLTDAVKSGDKAAVGAQIAATGKDGCGACHTSYRVKLE
jgi:cytochrome c556